MQRVRRVELQILSVVRYGGRYSKSCGKVISIFPPTPIDSWVALNTFGGRENATFGYVRRVDSVTEAGGRRSPIVS